MSAGRTTPEHERIGEASAPPHRIRAADLLAEQRSIIHALLERGGGENSSVVLTRNAKGETQIEVTVRTDAHLVTTAELAMEKARELYDAACEAYPFGVHASSGEPAARLASGAKP